MKNLKIRFGLFSLLAILAASVLLTSCEQENLNLTDEDLIAEEQVQINADLENPVTSRSFNKPCFVKLCYSSYLRRCGDAGGINYWLGVLGNAPRPSVQKIADVALGFITSVEASNKWENQYASFLAARGLNRNQISKHIYIAYRGLLLRQPDVNGGKYWTHIANIHGLRTAVIHIASSQEFFNRLGNIGAECNAYNANCN